jgi:GNAT superfamily N-acetyltransferase
MLESSIWSGSIVTIDSGRIHFFLEHLLRLDEGGRLQRFCHPASDIFLHDYAARLDLAGARIIGFFEGGRMRAAAELIPSGTPRSRVLEATFSVELPWRGLGVGTALLLRAISVARELGANHILMDCLAANERMRRIIARFDADLLFGSDDCKAWLPLVERPCYGPVQASAPAAR